MPRTVLKKTDESKPGRTNFRWTKEQEAELISWWGKRTVASMARYFKISAARIRNKAYQMGLGSQITASGERLSVPDVSRLLGIGTFKVYSYIRKLILPSRRIKVGLHTRFVVSVESLILFLKEKQDCYDTRVCDLVTLRAYCSPERIKNTNVTSKGSPFWLEEKIANDKNRPPLRGKRKSWKKTEEATLVQLLKSGKTHQQIARELGRSRYAIIGKVKGLEMTNLCEFWYADDIQEIIDQTNAGKTVREIAEYVGKSETAVRNKTKELGLTPNSVSPWTEQELDLLRVLAAEGKSNYQIAEILCKSACYISTKIFELGIPRQSKFWSVEDDRQLSELRGRGETVVSICAVMSRSRSAVRRRIKHLNI